MAEPRFRRVHPQVFVTDMDRALSFYGEGLGFEVVYTYGDPAHYALLERSGLGINLRHVDVLPHDPAVAAREDLLAVTFVVEGLADLRDEFAARGLGFHQDYRQQPWGAFDFIVADPDGNLIHFGSAPQEG